MTKQICLTLPIQNIDAHNETNLFDTTKLFDPKPSFRTCTVSIIVINLQQVSNFMPQKYTQHIVDNLNVIY